MGPWVMISAGWYKVISMMKLGQTKVPIEKVPALAKVCGVDEAYFMRLAMQEYLPETWKAIQHALGEALTPNESAMLAIARDVFPEDDMKLDKAGKATLKDALETH